MLKVRVAEPKCFYDPSRYGKHQCPKCKRWYCDECYEMFLLIDPQYPAETASICQRCHYDIYASIKREAIIGA